MSSPTSRTVLGGYDDPKLPVRNVDVAFFHRVLHHIEHRSAYLDTVARYLKLEIRAASAGARCSSAVSCPA